MTSEHANSPTATPAQPSNVTWQPSKVSSAERQRILGQKPMTVWLTGLSASGKTTLAFELEKRLLAARKVAYVLDGDNVRHGLSRDLDFSPRSRSENIRRVAEVARLFNDAGLIVITAFISPYIEDRTVARAIAGASGFAEVFVDAPLAICEQRDPKGLYKKARSGGIAEFTGVSAPYERPESPELHLRTDLLDAIAASERLYQFVAQHCFEPVTG